MHQTKDQLYDAVRDIISEKDFEREIRTLSDQFDGLLDDDTLALFIVDKLGRNTQALQPIGDIAPDSEATVVGTVKDIGDIRTFNRKNGSIGRVVNITLGDDSGICTLVLWDKDVKLVENNALQTGSVVKVINGYIKQGYTGIELNVGRWGMLEIISQETSQPDQKQTPTPPENEVEGEILSIEPTRAFFRDNGDFGFVTTITIKTKEDEREIVVWGEKVKELQQFTAGDHIHIRGLTKKEHNGKPEIHLNGTGTVTRC